LTGADGEAGLVSYATGSVTTAEVATEVGRTLDSAGLAVEVRPVGEVGGGVGRYGAVVGSAIRAGKCVNDRRLWALLRIL
jgi:menaquinone-dependent protoporphyrinogen IX oxidase